MRKIQLHRFHIKLGPMLLAVFIAIILVEIFVLYRAFYRDSQSQGPVFPQTEPILRIDFVASDLAKTWFSGNQNFAIEPYGLTSAGAGRENPLVEY